MNKKGMNKKAQFFLIAALIIAGVILALSQTFSKATVQSQDTLVYELSDQVYYESNQVIDNGLLTQKSESQTANEIANLTEYYARLNPDSDISIVYGSDTSLNEIVYDNAIGESVSKPAQTFTPDEQIEIEEGKEKKVRVELKSKNKQESIVRDFDIKKGQNFYIVVRKKIQNEQIVISK